MSVIFRKRMIEIEIDGGGPSALEARAWLDEFRGHVFKVHGDDRAIRLHALGPQEEACREPINITSKAPKPLNLIANFAHTPFTLNGVTYASVEGFWQSLKFPDEPDRQRLACLFGSKAKDDGYYAPASDTFIYAGKAVRIGTWDHWQLMESANFEKFLQNDEARAALLSTGERPLVHRVARDSKTIPGVIMASIWMRIREKLRG